MDELRFLEAVERRITARAIYRLTLILSTTLVVLLWSGLTSPMGGGMHEPSGRQPVTYVVLGIGIIGFVIGILWMRAIARGTQEPDARDEEWWSRA